MIIITTEILVVIQDYLLNGAFFDPKTLIIAFITSAVSGFPIFLVAAFLIRHLHNLQDGLEKNKQQYQSLYENAPLSYHSLDSHGTIIKINKAWVDTLGYTQEEVLKHNIAEFITPEEHVYLKERFEVFLQNGFIHDANLTFIKKDKTTIVMKLEGRIAHDYMNDTIATHCILEDITAAKKAKLELEEQHQLLRSVIDEIPYPIIVKNSEGKFLLVNAACANLYASTSEDMVGKDDGDFIEDKEQAEFFRKNVQEIMRKGETTTVYEDSFDVRTGERRNFKSFKKPYKNSQGEAQILVIAHDITESKHYEEKLKLLASVFTYTHEGIIITDTENKIVDVNEAFLHITGYSRDEVIGQNPNILKSDHNDKNFYIDMWDHLYRDGFWRGEMWNRNKAGEEYLENLTISTIFDYDRAVQNYIAIFTDITVQKQQQEELLHIAHYDTLTNLPNRVLFSDRINQGMTHALRRRQQIAIVYIDLDGFKAINDTHGHDIGDKLLIKLAKHMNQLLREDDTLSREGGDEFVALLIDVPNKKAIVSFLTRLLEVIAEPIHIDNLVLSISASIGATLYPQKEELDADQLIRQADQAMYQAKVSGKSKYHIFDTENARLIRGKHQELDRIRVALKREEFVLYYQPKINIRTGEVLGAEALIRWQHPEDGLLPPSSFLPLIENHELSIQLDQWVIEQALKQLLIWESQEIDLSISVNITALSLQKNDFVLNLQTMLQLYEKVNPALLTLEVLETSALEDLKHVSDVIITCATLGVKFALDDFGTGYSSLTYLKHLPAEQLKIDQSFVRDMLTDSNDLAIIDGVLGFANAFGREAIAEGIESIEHGVILLQLGCELGQGYAIARPMPVEKIGEWTNTWKLPAEWQAVRIIHRSEMPLLFASTEHRGWIKALLAYLEGIHPLSSKLESKSCNFGQWLHEKGKQTYGHTPVYEAIHSLHEKVHAQARKLVKMKQHDVEIEAIQQELDSFHKLSQELLKQLSALYA